MLKDIPALISPDMLKILAEMGHGDQLAIVDANFPAASHTRRLIRADGVSSTDILTAILHLLPIDNFCEHPARSMAVVGDDTATPDIVNDFNKILSDAEGKLIKCQPLERQVFYEEAKISYAIVITGERRLYGNLLLKKGVIHPE